MKQSRIWPRYFGSIRSPTLKCLHNISWLVKMLLIMTLAWLSQWQTTWWPILQVMTYLYTMWWLPHACTIKCYQAYMPTLPQYGFKTLGGAHKLQIFILLNIKFWHNIWHQCLYISFLNFWQIWKVLKPRAFNNKHIPLLGFMSIEGLEPLNHMFGCLPIWQIKKENATIYHMTS